MNNKLVLVDNSIKDFSSLYRVLSNSGLIDKNDNIYTNSGMIYHYCLYCRIKHHWLFKPTKKDWDHIVKSVKSILLIESGSVNNDNIQKLAKKYKKKLQIINL